MAGIEVVDELTESIEPLLATVSTYTLDRLDFVENEDETAAPNLAQDCKQAAKETTGAEVVEIPFDPSNALDVGADVRLAHKPGEKPLGHGMITAEVSFGWPVAPPQTADGWH